ncbi:MAG TPA: hypothetical protein PLV27_07555 [Anaerolineaceae bacterium]|nr:hypothetical protein [Anaerolineaceae bacterium]
MEQHRKQFLMQILVPVLAASAGVLVVAVLAVLSVQSTPSINEKWAHISTILLILPGILVGLFVLSLILLFSWLMVKLSRQVSSIGAILQVYFDQTKRLVEKGSTYIVQPIFWINSSVAGFQHLKHLIQMKINPPKELKWNKKQIGKL